MGFPRNWVGCQLQGKHASSASLQSARATFFWKFSYWTDDTVRRKGSEIPGAVAHDQGWSNPVKDLSNATITTDSRYGFSRLDPLPTPEELDMFYRDKYYGLVAAGGRAPELNRLLQGGVQAQNELQWLRNTLWTDIREILEEQLPNRTERSLLDVGCGPGFFTRYMASSGWKVAGVEPARDAAEVAKTGGMSVYGSLQDYIRINNQRVNALTCFNVLEHLLDPAGMLESMMHAMNPESLLLVRVPNDFSLLQECARKKLDKDPWWIAIPDHINYFNFDSLRKLLEMVGFRVIDVITDFPMELFLLMGDDYVGDPQVGKACHQRRVNFELSVPASVRRELYRCFAKQGMGRTCIMFAKLAVGSLKEGRTGS